MNKKSIIKSTSGMKNVDNKLDLSSFNQRILSDSLGEFELPRLFYQLVIFVLDASQSMTREGLTGESKGSEIGTQIAKIIDRLKSSKNRNSFDVSMIAFSSTINHFLEVTNISKIDLKEEQLNPCDKVGNFQTFMADALLKSEDLINQYYLDHKDNSQVLLIILTDGSLHDYQKSFEIAERIKQNKRTTLSTCLFEDKKWNEELETQTLEGIRENIKSLASVINSGNRFFVSKIDPEEIRKHMIKSISTVSNIG